MKKVKRKVKEKGFLFIEIIDRESLERLNKKFGTNYSRSEVKKQINIKRKKKSFRFWKRLMEKVPKGAGL